MLMPMLLSNLCLISQKYKAVNLKRNAKIPSLEKECRKRGRIGMLDGEMASSER